jgi:hypothetical protein
MSGRDQRALELNRDPAAEARGGAAEVSAEQAVSIGMLGRVQPSGAG